MSEDLMNFGMETETVEEYEGPSLEKFTLNDADVGTTFGGVPSDIDIEKEVETANGFKYTKVFMRLTNEEAGQYLNIYMNFPLMNDEGFVEKLKHNFEFVRQGYDCVFSFMKLIDPTNIIDSKTGQEINSFRKINLQQVMEFLSNKQWIDIDIIPVSEESDYNSFRIIKID